MAYLTDADILIGLKKELAISNENSSKAVYAKFSEDITNSANSFSNAVFETKNAEIAWHAETGETGEIHNNALQAYIKWREMIVDIQPGTNLVDWKRASATPDQIEMSIEQMISVIEDSKDSFYFAETALVELGYVSSSLVWEHEEDRVSYRKYMHLVDEKNRERATALNLFYRVRRFIRRDKSSDSPEYIQLRDRSIRAEREQQETAAGSGV